MKNFIIPQISKINLPADVLNFFISLHDASLNFHPDTPFDDYVQIGTLDHKRTFTKAQAKELDIVLEKCFMVCDTFGADIYELALTVEGFDKFFATHLSITDRTAMEAFADQYAGDDHVPDSVKAFHVFGDTYFVCEKQDGTFYVEIENCYYEGTLREMAGAIYNWMDKELPEGYLEQTAAAE